MLVSDLSAAQFGGAKGPGGRERDGEIMGMVGERRLTQSLMSFLGFLRLFLGQGPLAEHVGGPSTAEPNRTDLKKSSTLQSHHLKMDENLNKV